MMILIIGAVALLLGYLFYSRFIEGIVRPFRETTPAYIRDVLREPGAAAISG